MKTREQLIKGLVVDLALPEKIIERVVAHQFNGVREALADNQIVEISGFGKFIFKKKIGAFRLASLYRIFQFNEKKIVDETLCERYRKAALLRRLILTNQIAALKRKLHEN